MRKRLPLLLLLMAIGQAVADGLVVIGHPGLPRLDPATLRKLYTGRIIEIDGVAVSVVNAPAGSPLRSRFLAVFLDQDEEKYMAYWTVRRFIGKGIPPRELAGNAEIIEFVQGRPGAIGYIDASALRPGLNVLSRK